MMQMPSTNYLFKGVLTLVVVAVVGLPINTLWHFTLLAAALVCILALPMAKFTLRKAAISGFALVAAMALNYSLPRAAIEEGHNLFLADEIRSNILPDSLPAPVYARFKQQFDLAYPDGKRCDLRTPGCWRSARDGEREVKAAYAQSMDDIFRPAKYSRVVDQVDFTDLAGLRAGFVNEIYYHWWGDNVDIKRASMPFFVMYELNERVAGSQLCWTGEVLWEREQGRFESIYNEKTACKTISPADAGKRVYGSGVDPARPLAMQLQSGTTLEYSALAREGCTLIALALVLILALQWRAWRNLVLPGLVIGATAVCIKLFIPELIHGYTILPGGDDGLTHEGYGREILRDLLTGNVALALRGGEDVYYFMPGMRYLRALGLIVFGETNFGYLAMMLAFPLLVYGVIRLLLPRFWGLAVLAVASSLIFQCITYASGGYADPMGYALFLAAMWLMLKPSANLNTRWFGFLILALSVFVRPNLAVAALLLILFYLWQSSRTMPLRAALISSSGFGVILLVPIHNYVFGHRLVPLTAAASIPENLKAPPAAYIHALADLVSGDWASASVEVVARHLHNFLASWVILGLLLGLAAWAYRKRVQTAMTIGWLLVTVGMFLPFLFYDASRRYRLLAWLCAIILGAGYVFLLRTRAPKPAET